MYGMDSMVKETKTIKFKNYDVNGKLSEYELTLDWSLYSILNMHVYDEDDNELFFTEVDLDWLNILS